MYDRHVWIYTSNCSVTRMSMFYIGCIERDVMKFQLSYEIVKDSSASSRKSRGSQHGQTYRTQSALILAIVRETTGQEYINRGQIFCPISVLSLALQAPRSYQLF